jgi:hypothetical protein
MTDNQIAARMPTAFTNTIARSGPPMAPRLSMRSNPYAAP